MTAHAVRVGQVEASMIRRIEEREPIVVRIGGRRVEVSVAGVREVRPV